MDCIIRKELLTIETTVYKETFVIITIVIYIFQAIEYGESSEFRGIRHIL